MRVLPFPADLPIERQFKWIHAHMLFPDSPAHAQSLFVRQVVRSELKDFSADKEISMPVGWIRDLAFGPSLYEVAKMEKVRNRQGMTAGGVLNLVFFMTKGGYDRPSVRKAVTIIETHVPKQRRQGIRLPYYSDRKEILAAWKKMRDSAHFWAALELVSIPMFAQDLKPGPEQMGAFLRLAAALRQFGCAHRESHTRSKKTLMDASNSLQLPDFIERDAPVIGDIPLSEDIRAILKDYKAPQAM